MYKNYLISKSDISLKNITLYITILFHNAANT